MNDTYDEYMDELDSLLFDDELIFTEASLKDKKKDELVDMCKELGLKVSGNKPDLIERIMEYQFDNVITVDSVITVSRKDEDEPSEAEEPAQARRV
jgi:hypothetical protein